jgi:RNA polymerase sigma factor for flagellar operon FliA
VTAPPREASFEEVWAERKDDVVKIAYAVSRHRASRDVVDQLVSAGQVALWLCTERYDPDRGSFWPWARTRVRGAMVDELREADRLTRDDRAKVKRGEELVPWALVHSCGIEHAEGVPTSDDPEARLQAAESLAALRREVSLLPDRLRYVIERTLVRGDKLTEVAVSLGVTASRACQMRGEALSMLRREHVVYCEICQKKRFDGPQNCPTCGSRLRHLLPGEEVPAEPHAPWTGTKNTVNRGSIAAGAPGGSPSSPAALPCRQSMQAPRAIGSPEREYEEAREGGERVPDEYEESIEEIEEVTEANSAGKSVDPGVSLGDGVEKMHKGRKLRYLITYQGRTQGTAAWVRELGISRITVFNRIRRGLSAADVLSTTNYRRASAQEPPADPPGPARQPSSELPAREPTVTALAVVPPGRAELARPIPGGAEEAGDEIVNQVQALFDRLDEIEAARMPHRTRRDELMAEINMAYDQVASLEKQVAELDAVLAPLDSERNAILARMKRACEP